MASTYTGQNAIDLVRKYIKDIPLSGSTVDIFICDIVSSIMYTAYPWRWTLAALTTIALTDGVQDYTLGGSDAANFYRLVRCRINQTNLTPDAYKELDIVEALPPNLESVGLVREDFAKVSWEHTISKLRLDKAADIVSPVVMQVEGEYQKNPTKVTALSTTYWFPDQYFPVFTEGVLWKAYQFADDDRAGTVQFNDQGQAIFSGQMGLFFASLQAMVRAEDWGVGQPFSFPPNALGLTRSGWVGSQNKQ